MTLTIEVPPGVQARLAADAARQGMALPEYIAQVLARVAEGPPTARPRRGAPPAFEAARRLRTARDAMPPLGIPLRDLIEAGRER